MSRNLLIIGCVALLVGLGFVFPQLAQLRLQGHLAGGGIALLFFGLLVSLAGAGSAVYALKSFKQKT